MGTDGPEHEHARGTRDGWQCNGSGTDARSHGTGGNKVGEGWTKEMNIMKMSAPPPPPPPPLFLL